VAGGDGVASAVTPTIPVKARLASLDQFRGYTVAGMFLVNFAGSFLAIQAFLPTLKHWHTHISYADTIMPQFLFAVGFSFRMTFLKRREQLGATAANWRVVRRILGLILVALIVHGMDGRYNSWQELKDLGVGGFFTNSFQRSYFQTLAHIAVTSLWVVPVIGAGLAVRIGFALLSAGLFFFLSSSWYYDWVLTRPGVDGGPLGFLSWTSTLILGTIAYDIWAKCQRFPVLVMFTVGCLVMLGAYGLSCVNTFTYPNALSEQATWEDRLVAPPFFQPYNLGEGDSLEAQRRADLSVWEALTVAGQDEDGRDKIPQDPRESLKQKPWIQARNEAYNRAVAEGVLEAESPRDQVPEELWREADLKYLNQWTMSQRAGSLSYTIFGGGFSMALLALMIVVCDRWGVQIGLFRTFGMNALVGYILHDMVNSVIKPFVPRDAPLWYVLAAFGVSLGICYLVLRNLEKQKIFFRL